MNGFGLGALDFQLMADLAPLRRDMDEAKGLVGGALGGIKGAFTNMLGGLAAGLGVAAFAGWIKGAIDAGDATKQFSQKTGIAVKDVAGLQLAFKQGNVDSELLTKAMGKMGSAMVDGHQAFDTLGVKTRNVDGSLRDAKAVLYDTADALKGVEDITLRNALAADIFTKAGQALIPTLGDGSEGLIKYAALAEKLGLVMSEETATAADDFNDTVELLGMASQGTARQVAAQLLPTLKSLAGTFLDNVTSGDKLKKGADILAGGLKLLFTGGAIGVEVFNTLGKVVGGVAGALISVAQGEFGQAWKILEESGRDITRGWGETAKTVEDAWTGAGAATVNQAVAMTGATQRATVATKEQAAEAKKHAEEVAKLTKAGADYLDGLDAQLVSVRMELELGRSLTDAEKAMVKLEEQLREGKMQLTDAQREGAAARLVEIEAMRAQLTLGKELDKIQTEAILKGLEDSAGIAEQAKRQREHNEAIGLTAAGLRTLESRRLDDSLATAEQALQQAILKGISAEELEGITLMVEELRGLKKAKEEGWAKDAGLEAAKAAKDAASEWQKMTDSVYAGLTDSLMRAFENGKGFLDAFKDTLLNAFKTLILQPMVKSMVGQLSGGLQSVMGMLGTSGGGSTVGGDMGGIKGNNAGAAAGAAGMAGSSWIPYVGWAMAAIGQASTDYDKGWTAQAAGRDGRNLNTAINPFAGFFRSAISNDKWASVLSGDTAMARLFGRKAPETTAQGISGSFGGAGFTGQAFQDWHAEGGLFRSDKNGTNTAALDAALGAELTGTSQAMLQHIKDYATALALPVTALAGVTTTARIELGDDAAKNKVAIDAALSTYGEALVRGYESQLAAFGTVGESAIDTLNRLGGSLTSVNSVFQTLGLHLADTSLAGGQAASELIALTGGLDAFMSKTQAYLGAYYSQGEQSGISAKAIIQTLSAAGIDAAAFNDRGDLRGLMDSLDPNATGGRSQMAALLNVSADFAKLTDYLAETGQTLGDLAAQAPQSPLGGTMGIDPVEQSNALLQTANDNLASIAAATQANTTELQALVAVQSAGTQSLVDRLREIADGLTNAMRPGYLAEMAQE